MTSKPAKSTELKVNEHLLKVSAASIALDQPLGMDEEVMIVLRGDVVDITDKSNQDGTINRVYTVKGFISFNATKEYEAAKEESGQTNNVSGLL